MVRNARLGEPFRHPRAGFIKMCYLLVGLPRNPSLLDSQPAKGKTSIDRAPRDEAKQSLEFSDGRKDGVRAWDRALGECGSELDGVGVRKVEM